MVCRQLEELEVECIMLEGIGVGKFVVGGVVEQLMVVIADNYTLDSNNIAVDNKFVMEHKVSQAYVQKAELANTHILQRLNTQSSNLKVIFRDQPICSSSPLKSARKANLQALLSKFEPPEELFVLGVEA